MNTNFNNNYLLNYKEKIAYVFSYAIDNLNIDIDEFENRFKNFEYITLLEKGDPHFVSGTSAIELVHEIFKEIKIDKTKFNLYSFSKAYWAGYYLSHYAWYSSYSYKEIFSHIPLKVIISLYNPYHEMDISKFIDFMDLQMDKKRAIALKKIRIKKNMTQKELSIISNVSLRMIELYEEGRNDIKKAEVGTIYKLAKALDVTIEELISY